MLKEQHKKPFIITIDTEGDNLWAKPEIVTTENTSGLYRFQELCNKFGFKPVYLTNYEMANDDHFIEFGKTYLEKGECEIGMHLHAWNSPPAFQLTDNDMIYQPFMMEYPKEEISKKVGYITDLLTKRFETTIVSHRAGRWAMNKEYFEILGQNGYLVDCSVTPGVDWSNVKGNPLGYGGSDYSKALHQAYVVKTECDCDILEVPMTIDAFPRVSLFNVLYSVRHRLPKSLFRLCFKNEWLRPARNNLEQMKKLVDVKLLRGCSYLEFMIHSSELSAGLNPNFKTEEAIEKLYADMESLFAYIAQFGYGCTLQEYHLKYKRGKA